MEHRLVRGIEKSLGWPGPSQLGREFARGSLPNPELCGRLLTPTRLLDLVMRRSLPPHRLRCLVNGADLHPQDYLTMSTARRGQAVPMADMRLGGRLLRSGCTLIVDEINTYDPTMEVACRALQWWCRELVQVNIYLTTGDAAGFQLHWDDHDVLIVQLAGEKTWEVRGLSRKAPMYRDSVPNFDPPDEITWVGMMRAGDVMHIPPRSVG
jgi:JmjC domain